MASNRYNLVCEITTVTRLEFNDFRGQGFAKPAGNRGLQGW